MMLLTSRKSGNLLLPLLAILIILATGAPVLAASAKTSQKSFASPEEALNSLVVALKNHDKKNLLAILGPGAREIVSSGDPVADKAGREQLVKLHEEKVVIEGADSGKAVFSLGNEDYPFPIPVVKKGNAWRFDAKAGKEELLNRRIGRNELKVIEVLHAYADAQREYAAKDRTGEGVGEFAQKIRSTPGKRDGLYWATKEGEEESPLGPLAAQAADEGYSKENTALYGYRYKVLKAQGPHAEGGAFDYVVNGRMVLGFGLVAYPAQYGASGIMTFIVNQNGIVYQKNLGRNTAKVATKMPHYDPDETWKKVE
ncbi:DUF2950 domain-containing protein [Geobacter sp.]|uniref:DUF2950 domain-containing protein n=1 Tax=Geobacter sp. TaxID=46610 RepID=UPI0027B9E930|nr:DUF2950 domain-containing protein [Geobacter sp.]